MRPETVFIWRVCVDYCVSPDLKLKNLRRDSNLTAETFAKKAGEIMPLAAALVDQIETRFEDYLFNRTQTPTDALVIEEAEFMLRELLLLAVNLDHSDEFGRRGLSTLMRAYLFFTGRI